MVSTTSYLLLLLAGTRALAATQPACVQTCISENPTSSFCDGDETGDDLAKCTCQSISGSLMLQCIQKCPEADQATYASGLPGSCGKTLFPDLDMPETTTTSSSAAASTPTSTATESGPTGSQTPASGGDSGGGAAAGLTVPTWMLLTSIVGVGINRL